MGIGRVGFVDGKVEAIIAIQAVFRAEPEEALLVLDDGSNRELGEPLFHRNMVEPNIGGLGKKRGGEMEPEKKAKKSGSIFWLFCHTAK
jgi:hypothetical protein